MVYISDVSWYRGENFICLTAMGLSPPVSGRFSDMMKNKLVKVGLWKRIWTDFKLLALLIKDYWKGVYRDVHPRSCLFFALTILYVLSPVDILTDVAPILGQIDDALILMVCLFFLEKDLKKYQSWKSIRDEKKDAKDKNG